MATFVNSAKSKPMLSLNGYLYTQHSKNKKGDRQYWRCTERDKCNARSTTDVFNHAQIYADGTKNHTHPPMVAEIKAREAVQRIKRRAQKHPNEPPHQVIAGELTHEHNEEVLANLPEHQNLRRSVNRAQNSRRPTNPNDLNSLEIVEPYTETIRKEKFSHFDSGPDEESRLIIFTTKRNLEILCQSPMIFSNGTFKTAPDMFTQLFTVHGLYKDHLFPLVYALTTRKDEETYDRLYLELKSLSTDYGFTLRPEKAMCDFELGNMNAARTQFPGVQIKGCLFHFSQNTWKQVVDNGLKVAFTNDENVRAQIQHLLGLTFIPLEDIPEVFEEISQDVLSDEVAAIYESMEVTYVSGRPARGRRHALPPRFPPEIWNVHEAVLHNHHRTNNMVEGFHNKFQKSAQAHHTKIWWFLDVVRADQNTNERHQAQLRAGHRKIRQARSSRYESSQNQLRIVVSSYEEYKTAGDIRGLFLKACAYHTKFGAVENAEEPPKMNTLVDEFESWTKSGTVQSDKIIHWTKMRVDQIVNGQT